MQPKGVSNTNRPPQHNQKNTVETLSDLGSSLVKNTASSFKNIGGGMMDQFLGGNPQESRPPTLGNQYEQPQPAAPIRKEFTLFHRLEHEQSNVVPKEITQLHEEIKKEVQAIKKQSESMLSEAQDAQMVAINTYSEKTGVYHIRFLEIVLTLLRNLRAKIGESHTWLSAMTNKRKKRGSAYATISKKKGTQYSMSQELSTARSVQ